MTRNTKDNYFVFILVLIGFSMVMSICSSDSNLSETNYSMSNIQNITSEITHPNYTEVTLN